jgi:peptide/nickel transport system ATP-binding protein
MVGESGSGKSTLARTVMALDAPTSGSAPAGARSAPIACGRAARARRDFQMVFQDPYGSLDPRQTVARIVSEPLQAQGHTTRAQQRERAAEVLARGPAPQDLDKYPHEFSGGQRQRIAIARA